MGSVCCRYYFTDCKEVQATYGFVIQLYFIFIVIANALTVGTVRVSLL